MSISLTEQAAEHVKSFLGKEEQGIALRLGVERTGCSGWAYTVATVKSVNDDDQVFEDRGVKIVVDAQALELINGTHVDFVQQGLNRNFVFDNPQVTEQCGCGESFTISEVG